MIDIDNLIRVSSIDYKNNKTEKYKHILETYKLIKAKFVEFKTAKNAKPLDYKNTVAILNKMLKERLETAEIYKMAKRFELAESEQFEADIIKGLLPKEASFEDIEKATKNYISENGDITQKEMGKVIKEIKSHFDNCNGKLLSDIVKKYIK